MRTSPERRHLAWSGTLLFSLLLSGVPAIAAQPPRDPQSSDQEPQRLPAFSEEREAAALCFVQKHAEELVPVLDRLRASDPKRYHTEIRELFQVSELLTELRERDEKRYALELESWKTETQALLVVAQMAQVGADEQPKLRDKLMAHTRRLVDLEMQLTRQRVAQLERELDQARGELVRNEERREAVTKARYDRLIEQAKRRGVMK